MVQFSRSSVKIVRGSSLYKADSTALSMVKEHVTVEHTANNLVIKTTI